MIKRRSTTILGIAVILCCGGCAAVSSSAKYEFREGLYKSRALGGSPQPVYVVPSAGAISVYPIMTTKSGEVADTSRMLTIAAGAAPATQYTFYKPSFDVDVLTILLKYRPQIGEAPRQLNTSFNGALYAGYRNDVYRLSRHRNMLGIESYHTTHLGISGGAFGGIGTTAMNPFVTSGNIINEYDGFIFSAGLSVILGLNNLTVGLGLGADHLADANREHWIYQHKPWLGLMFGLNLN